MWLILTIFLGFLAIAGIGTVIASCSDDFDMNTWPDDLNEYDIDAQSEEHTSKEV